jgi:Protein of unknown function (DUF3631)
LVPFNRNQRSLFRPEDWGEKARAAAIRIEGKADNRTVGVRLLTDIKALFDVDPLAHCMSSAAMVEALTKDPEKIMGGAYPRQAFNAGPTGKAAGRLRHHFPDG